MNTDRISIKTIDSSRADLATATNTALGYTVVHAPRGPMEPLFIPAGYSSKLKSVFGMSSADYPMLFEAETYNKSHDIYISAPYDKTSANKIPVAYATPAGILAAASPVDITGKRIEDVFLIGEEIEGINTFASNPEVLIPTVNANLHFGDADRDKLAYNVAMVGSALEVTVGFDVRAASLDAETDYLFMNSTDTGVFYAPVGAVATLVLDIEGYGLLEFDYTIAGETHTLNIPAGVAVTDSIILTDEVISFLDLTGATLPAAYAVLKDVAAMTSLVTAQKVKAYWKATVQSDSVVATIYQKYLGAEKVTITFSDFKAGGNVGNEFSCSIAEALSPTYSCQVSLLDAPSYSQDPLTITNEQDIIGIHRFRYFTEADTLLIPEASVSSDTNLLEPVYLQGGSRDADDTSVNLEQGWVLASQPEFDAVECFFSSKQLGDTDDASAFYTLAATHSLSRFIASKYISAATLILSKIPYLNYGKNYFITTNQFKHMQSGAYTPLTGYYAKMIGSIIKSDKQGGIAPMYLNENELGGQICPRGVVSTSELKFSRAQKTLLDRAGYNPIVDDPNYGVMATSHRTAVGGEITDWSYIGHTSAFLKFLRDVRDLIMVPQIGKPNNPEYQQLRATQLNTLIRSRTLGGGRIWAAAVADIAGVNTPEIQAQRKFLIKVQVKVDIFSELVELVFENVNQTTTIA